MAFEPLRASSASPPPAQCYRGSPLGGCSQKGLPLPQLPRWAAASCQEGQAAIPLSHHSSAQYRTCTGQAEQSCPLPPPGPYCSWGIPMPAEQVRLLGLLWHPPRRACWQRFHIWKGKLRKPGCPFPSARCRERHQPAHSGSPPTALVQPGPRGKAGRKDEEPHGSC